MTRPVSEYALGEFGWLATAMTLAEGVGVITLAVALLRTSSRDRLRLVQPPTNTVRVQLPALVVPTDNKPIQASASWAARTPLFRLTSLSSPGAATRSPTR